MNDDDNDKVNENISREMEEHNLLLKEKAEAFKKLAEALNENYESHLTKPHTNNEVDKKNKPETKLNN